MCLLKITENLTALFQEKKNAKLLNDDFSLRIHRSLSWLRKAAETEDLDTKFIYLWIAFNAAYARELNNMGTKDRVVFNEFLLRICAHDEAQKIYHLIWAKFTGSIRLLTSNKYVFQPFWDFHNQKISEEEYGKARNKDREKLLLSFKTKNTERLLSVLFERLYTLRNQILHGGATFNSRVNRDQIRDSNDILTSLIPTMLEIMLRNHNAIDWGKPFYPVVN
ncbi:HEPN domain-containing protein [Bisgaard Taxon 10/6]|uniref:HEPN domain-containing protein n=1 Tax=Exercitatus varius TaxID=67857 RepID=A0ABT6EV73_9PAST|nr:HEPN domain-containing protein [Exercitatus varius]MDG2938716.1 HEPN domain-containing protein [Exercitatus varius]MDG2946082.1 HEPN domain-containing protein [Exercitatus varius]MDG2955396.1 HEPN domain-containing protein [Exercitatus varius]MDG2962783.1 HEPN domain-containing protein [Exercitatus varius]MDG2963677.1 HEPN domain-containing protein [Exercitatus varius]